MRTGEEWDALGAVERDRADGDGQRGDQPRWNGCRAAPVPSGGDERCGGEILECGVRDRRERQRREHPGVFPERGRAEHENRERVGAEADRPASIARRPRDRRTSPASTVSSVSTPNWRNIDK
jgi:hypothetical protein